MQTRVLRIVLGLGILAAVNSPAAIPDPSETNMFWAEGIGFPVREQAKVFAPQEKQANFTFHDGVKDWQVQDDALAFVLTSNRALLGWGNYMDKQPPAAVADLWSQNNSVRLKVRVSEAVTGEWTLNFWRNGARCTERGLNPVKLQVKLTANAWTNVTLPQTYGSEFAVIPDGFDLEFNGPAGTRVEIGEVRVVRTGCEGYCRKEFDLPAGKVWRAIADVGGPESGAVGLYGARLYINGQEVKRHGPLNMYGTAAVDIAPYLKPGKNVAGFYGCRYTMQGYNPFIYFQARIVMESGAEVRWKTDTTWKYSPDEQPGWSEAGFVDSTWSKVISANATGYRNLRDNAGALCLAGESGRIRMKNPGGPRLAYPDTGAVTVEAWIPAGLKDKSPVLEYEFGRADADGQSTALKSGEQKQFTPQGDSLVYQLNLGRQPPGVYTVALRLKGADGQMLEERGREPVLVLGALRGTGAAAVQDLLEGLDAELEDTVDFTNPNDPHPSHEATTAVGTNAGVAVPAPLVVERNGLKYRETRPERLAFFAYRIAFKHPGSWYMLELEYPDDAHRVMGSVLGQFVAGAQSDSGPGVETGGRFYPTGKLQTLRWVYVAEQGPQAFYLLNLEGGSAAAAKGLKIYRIKGALPSTGGGINREFGIHTERCMPDSGFARDFGTDPWRWLPVYMWKEMFAPEQAAQKTAYELNASVTTRILRDLVWFERTCARYVEYLKFTGQNMYIMGIYQASEINTPIARPYDYETARLEPTIKHVLAQVLEANGIGLYAGLELSQFPDINERYQFNNSQVARGADTVWMVDGEGRQFPGLWITVVPNWLHPAYQKRFREYLTEITAHFGYLKCFRGVHFWGPSPTQGLDGYWPPAWTDNYDTPLKYSYDDVTFALFAKDTGMKLPIAQDDPQRFQKRAALMLAGSPLRQKFITWRCEKLKEYFADGLGVLQAARKDLVWKNAVGIENPPFFQKWLESGKSYPDYLKDFGIDLALLDTVPDLWNGRWTHSWAHGNAQNPYCWLPKVDPRITDAYSRGSRRYVFVRTTWCEVGATTAGSKIGSYYGYGDRLARSDWIPHTLMIRTVPQPSGYHAREAFIQALITGDPDTLIYGLVDVTLNVGHEQELRNFSRILTHLPPERFETVLNTGLESNLAIRQLEKDGQTYLYVANPAYWAISGELVLAGRPQVKELVACLDAALTQKDGHSVLPLVLEPYGLLAWRAAGTGVKVESYRTGAPGEPELAFLRGIIARVTVLTKNEETKLALAPADLTFMERVLAEANVALEKGEYAKAWARVTGTQFWALWKNYLEKAAKYLVRLPAGTPVADAEKKTADGLRVLTAARAPDAITLDGKLDEAAWGKMPFQTGFVTKDNKPAMVEAGLKAVYDDRAIYLGLICADKDVKALKAEGDGTVGIFARQDDSIVMFIQPDEKTPIYYQLGFNTKGVPFNQKVTGGDKNYSPLPGWKSAAAAGEKVWTAEVQLPYATFGLAGRGNGQWRLNVHRVFRNLAVDPCSWNFPGENEAGGGGAWHNTKRFGRLEFSEK